MKLKYAGAVLLLMMLSISAFRFIAGTLEEVGTTLEEVKKQTIYQLADDHFSPYYTTQIRDACKNLPLGVREATMMSVGKTIHDYVESPQFKVDYEKYLNETYTGSTFDASDERWANRKKEKLDEFTRLMNSGNATLIQAFLSALDIDAQSKQSMVDMMSNPAMKDMLASMPPASQMTQDIKDDKILKDLYTKNQAEFKKKYPEMMASRTVRDEMFQEKNTADQNTKDAAQKIAARKDYKARLRLQLQEFLTATASIDFNAATKENGDGVKIFVNPDYEAKDGQWKFYYRCGKESIGGARKYAQNWLSSLH